MTARLADLAQQRARLEARAAELRTMEKALARQSDSRRKIVVGAIILKAAETDGRAREWLIAQLRKAVADRDRALFTDLLSGDEGDA